MGEGVYRLCIVVTFPRYITGAADNDIARCRVCRHGVGSVCTQTAPKGVPLALAGGHVKTEDRHVGNADCTGETMKGIPIAIFLPGTTDLSYHVQRSAIATQSHRVWNVFGTLSAAERMPLVAGLVVHFHDDEVVVGDRHCVFSYRADVPHRPIGLAVSSEEVLVVTIHRYRRGPVVVCTTEKGMPVILKIASGESGDEHIETTGMGIAGGIVVVNMVVVIPFLAAGAGNNRKTILVDGDGLAPVVRGLVAEKGVFDILSASGVKRHDPCIVSALIGPRRLAEPLDPFHVVGVYYIPIRVAS